MRNILLRITIGLLTVCGTAATANGAPILISYAAIVTSNSGEATDSIFPPGIGVRVQVLVDSESLLRGVFLPATGSAETGGGAGMSLEIEEAGSGLLIGIPGATARVYSFRGTGPSFEADGDPPSDDIWRWSSANLYLPLVADLDSLLALTLDDINALIAAFGSMQLLTFTHEINPNAFEFERARTSRLYEFSIQLASVPEPPLWPLVVVAVTVAVFRRLPW